MPNWMVGEDEPEDVPTPGTCQICLVDLPGDHEDWCPERKA